jgi:hypothetical protein
MAQEVHEPLVIGRRQAEQLEHLPVVAARRGQPLRMTAFTCDRFGRGSEAS